MFILDIKEQACQTAGTIEVFHNKGANIKVSFFLPFWAEWDESIRFLLNLKYIHVPTNAVLSILQPWLLY